MKTTTRSYIDNWMSKQTQMPELAVFNKAADDLADGLEDSSIKEAMMLIICGKLVSAKMQRLERQAKQRLKELLPSDATGILSTSLREDLNTLTLLTQALLTNSNFPEGGPLSYFRLEAFLDQLYVSLERSQTEAPGAEHIVAALTVMKNDALLKAEALEKFASKVCMEELRGDAGHPSGGFDRRSGAGGDQN